MEKAITVIFIFGVLLLSLMLYAHWWGNNECQEVEGNWIQMNAGFYCVDDEFNEIDIYNHD